MISVRTVTTYPNGESGINAVGGANTPQSTAVRGEKENTILQEVRKVFPEPNKAELSVYFNLGYSSSTYFFLDGNMDGET